MADRAEMFERARAMRREPTEAERVMWRLLRSRRFGGLKFRRQFRIGRYIADFICLDPRVVVGAMAASTPTTLTMPSATPGSKRGGFGCCVSGTKLW
jgi:hypothetical protein